MLVKPVQKLFVTRYFLPLTILGVILLAVHRRKAALAVILMLPLYYLFSHAPLHFEPRYMLPVYFFWFILAGLGIYWILLCLFVAVKYKKAGSTTRSRPSMF
jgi:apolipoprotein N-acyltransferase